MASYTHIVFLDGDDFTEWKETFNAHGARAALDYLCQWEQNLFHPEDLTAGEAGKWVTDTDTRTALGVGTADHVVRYGPYFLTYNLKLSYAGLQRRVDDESEADRQYWSSSSAVWDIQDSDD